MIKDNKSYGTLENFYKKINDEYFLKELFDNYFRLNNVDYANYLKYDSIKKEISVLKISSDDNYYASFGKDIIIDIFAMYKEDYYNVDYILDCVNIELSNSNSFLFMYDLVSDPLLNEKFTDILKDLLRSFAFKNKYRFSFDLYSSEYDIRNSQYYSNCIYNDLYLDDQNNVLILFDLINSLDSIDLGYYRYDMNKEELKMAFYEIFKEKIDLDTIENFVSKIKGV